MKGTLAVAAREIVERKLLLALAGFIALLIVVAPFVPGMSASDIPAHTRATYALAIGLPFLCLTALLLGVSIVSTELVERRMGFYFARPLSASAIWFGKVLGGLIVLLACQAAIALPTWLATSTALREYVSRDALDAHVLVVVLFSLGLAGSVIVRSRSPLALLDLVGLVAVILASFTALNHLRSHGFRQDVLFGMKIVAAVAAFGSLVGLVRGRADVRRAHLAQTLATWPVAVAGLLVAGIAVRFVDRRAADAWTDRGVQVATPDGRFLLARARGSVTGWAYLADMHGRRSFRLDDHDSNLADLSVDPGGRWAAWTVVEGPSFGTWLAERLDGQRPRTRDLTLRVLDLDRDVHDVRSAKLAQIRIEYDWWGDYVPTGMSMFVSPDAARVVLLECGSDACSANVLDTRTLKSVAQPVWSAGVERWRSAWVGPRTFRLFRQRKADVFVDDIDLGSSPVMRSVGRLKLEGRLAFATAAGTRVGDYVAETKTHVLRDLSGREIPRAVGRSSFLLRDGSAITFEKFILRSTAQDRTEKVFRLPYSSDWSILKEVTPGVLRVEHYSPNPRDGTHGVFDIDLASGTWRQQPDKLRPLSMVSGHAFSPGSEAFNLFALLGPDALFYGSLDGQAAIVRVDPKTGARRTLIPAGGRGDLEIVR